MSPKVLVVLTSANEIPSIKKPTGWYLPELAHPHHVLHNKVSMTMASPKGGDAPLDPSSVAMFTDDVSVNFLNNQKSLWTKTEKLSDMLSRVDEFDAIFYVGGHGPMFDLTSDQTSIKLIEAFAAAKKTVAAVCHGPCVFLNTKAPSGKSLLSGLEVTGFSNVEEDQVQLSSAMPFMLETELDKVSGGHYVKAAEPWGEKIVVAKTEVGGDLITGQNPASATGVGEAILKSLGI